MNYYNLARMYTTTTGDSDVTLTTAVPGCISFADAGVSDSEEVYYGLITYDLITHRPTGSESGLGKYISSGTVFQRASVETSTDSDNSTISLTGLSELFLMPTKAFFNAAATKAPVMWHDQSVFTGSSATQIDNAQAYGYYTYTSSDSDEFTNGFVCRAGTYTLKILGVTDADRGKLDIYIDSVLVSSGQDWYAASTTKNVTKSVASATISTDGYHTLRCKTNGKNASSSNYYMAITKIWLTPASY